MKSFRKRTGKKKEEKDQFLSLTDKVKLYLLENSSRAYAALGVIAAVLVLTVLVSLLMKQSHSNQLALQAEALAYYDLDSPVPGDEPMGAEDRVKKARELFTKITDEHSGGLIADMAMFYRANSDMDLGELDTAVEEYRSLTTDPQTGPVLYSVAAMRLACALKSRGDNAGALAVYAEMAKRGLMKDEAHYQAGQLYEQTGQAEQALFEYMAIKSDFPGSPRFSEASAKADKLGPKDEAAQGPPEAAEMAPAGGK